jgi:hypothetical protein
MAQPSPAVVPSSAHTSPTTKPREAPTSYPSNADGIAHTRLSYHKEPISELTEGVKDGWTLCLPIEIPSDLINPTLTSLVYTIKYATMWDNGNSTVQVDTFLTPESCPEGITQEPADLGVYHTLSGYGPVILNEEVALSLSSVPAIKYNGGTAQWSHYVDHLRLTPNLRIMQPSNLYLAFHVYEYPTTDTVRCLAVQASATWLDDLEEREWREMERKEHERSLAVAEPVANAEVQDRIREVGVKYGVNCPSGYAWNRVVDGYRCGGGGHFLTFQQLGMSRRSSHR